MTICQVFTYASRYLTRDSDSGRVQLATSTIRRWGTSVLREVALCQLLRFLPKNQHQTLTFQRRPARQNVRLGCGDFTRWDSETTHDCRFRFLGMAALGVVGRLKYPYWWPAQDLVSLLAVKRGQRTDKINNVQFQYGHGIKFNGVFLYLSSCPGWG